VNASPAAALRRTLGGRKAGGRGWRVARRIVQNISGFFLAPAEWSRRKCRRRQMMSASPDASDNEEACHEP
jgi:hypothetical protein